MRVEYRFVVGVVVLAAVRFNSKRIRRSVEAWTRRDSLRLERQIGFDGDVMLVLEALA